MVEAGAASHTLADHLKHRSQYHSQLLGDAAGAEVCCGQGAGLIDDVPDAADLVAALVEEMGRCFARLQTRLAGFL